ncbi:hypothetical protein [Parageobacillus thermoglucosidasius]|uniref:hypothetical protein n=1 Tax=Parageobacillus thermoglucosidasius TaxID=1426 RepID=UPI000B569DD1|nr:hypothetical protein [Parageobacillus thermoglucosidasius]MBY6268871.1 hypothetical protein [Parageobacillus thermoglucosidasius]OUM89258.1 MAG: hypothetical protein BAA00_13575 [Parageobacillus thermoglucosidasius]
MSKEKIKEFIIKNDKILKNYSITCSDIIDLKNQFYKEHGKKPRVAEAIILRWLHHYLGFPSENYEDEVKQGDLILRAEKKYPAELGNQTLDISILQGKDIKVGISIKMSTSTSAYLDGADFKNPFFDKYRSHFIKDEMEFEEKRRLRKRIAVPTLLQDMARIHNLQKVRESFSSLTIIYSRRKPKDDFWINEFKRKYNHQYIFLEETPEEAFGDVLTNKLPMVTDLLSK